MRFIINASASVKLRIVLKYNQTVNMLFSDYILSVFSSPQYDDN